MPLRRLLSAATGLPGAAVRAVTGVVEPRQVHSVPGRTRIPVRGVHRPGSEGMSRSLSRELLNVAGVAHAEVNAVLGLVLVIHDGEVPVDELVEIVEDVERRHDAQDEPFAHPGHPTDGQAMLREAAMA